MTLHPGAHLRPDEHVVDRSKQAHAALDAGLAVARPGALVAITMRAPVAAPRALLATGPARRDAAVWQPADGWSMACAGIAAEIRGAGAARFTEVAAAAPRTWSRLVEVGAADVPAPRFVGGLAFAPGAAAGPAWAGFGDARFVLPRWTYWRRGDAAWLTAVVDGDLGERGRDGWHGELAELRAALLAPPPSAARRLGCAEPEVIAVREADPDTWRRHVAEIRAAIVAGTCAKIVAARTCAVELSAPIDPAAILRQLGDRHGECTRFAIRTAGRVFAGASPERLVAVTGREVIGEALAGSIARGGDDAGELARLLASAKDRGEHDLVVHEIVRGLAPMCERLDVPAAPVVRSLRHVHHLHTPVRGQLAARRHAVEVAGALHPTPAVGGVPTQLALDWIAAREPEPRGWYGAPVGWFDAAGDGELVVAIRSGLLDGRHALLYAGAGIVRDSDVELEFDKTRVKLRALLGALGAA
jgi:salicylate biosynthesis isochorismate synthase